RRNSHQRRHPCSRCCGPSRYAFSPQILGLLLQLKQRPRYALCYGQDMLYVTKDTARICLKMCHFMAEVTRRQHAALVAFFLHVVRLLAAQCCAYEALDSSGVPTRDATRRGAGWLPGLADMGWSNRLGWYEGVHLLLAANPTGVITGCGCGAASTKDQ